MTYKYDGPERREYCEQHCQIKELSKKAVPWRFFVGTMSAFLMISIAYSTVNETRLGAMKLEYQKSTNQLSASLDKRISEQYIRYTEDVRRFYEMAHHNSELLNEVKENQREIKTKQDLVLKKIKITE